MTAEPPHDAQLTDDELAARCTRFLRWPGRIHHRGRLGQLVAAMPDIDPDLYGDGGVVTELEGEVAALLGKPAAVFMPSGTMAQQIALRIHADARHRRVVAFHPTSHLELHEGGAPTTGCTGWSVARSATRAGWSRKGLGGLSGCCLLGSEAVIAQAREWRSRHGGTLFALWPYAASALLGLREQLPLMPTYVDHAVAIAAELGQIEGVEVIPDPPQTPMMHLDLTVSADVLEAAARRLAREEGVWTWPRSSPPTPRRASGWSSRWAPGRWSSPPPTYAAWSSGSSPRRGTVRRGRSGRGRSGRGRSGRGRSGARQWSVTRPPTSPPTSPLTRPPSRPLPRLVATDLDGTIVPWDGIISDRTVAALRALEARGVPVVFATGRPPRWMAEVAERTGHTGLAVCANGAVLYDLHTETVVREFPLAQEVGLELARRLRAAVPEVFFAIETAEGFAHEPGYPATWDVGTADRVDAIEAIYGQAAVTKLLVRHEGMDADALLAAAHEAVGAAVAELTHSSVSGLLEISATGVSKASTLALVCAELGVDASEVIAFGDMPNDLPMLAWAGTSYAMTGGHPEVLAAVSRRARSVEADGVARVLESVFDL